MAKSTAAAMVKRSVDISSGGTWATTTLPATQVPPQASAIVT